MRVLQDFKSISVIAGKRLWDTSTADKICFSNYQNIQSHTQ